MDISIRFCSQGLQGFLKSFRRAGYDGLRPSCGRGGGQAAVSSKADWKVNSIKKMGGSQGITWRRLTRYLWQVLLPIDHWVRSKVLEPPLRLQFNPCSSKWSGSQSSPPLQSTFVFCINLSWCSRQLVQLFFFFSQIRAPLCQRREDEAMDVAEGVIQI